MAVIGVTSKTFEVGLETLGVQELQSGEGMWRMGEGEPTIPCKLM